MESFLSKKKNPNFEQYAPVSPFGTQTVSERESLLQQRLGANYTPLLQRQVMIPIQEQKGNVAEFERQNYGLLNQRFLPQDQLQKQKQEQLGATQSRFFINQKMSLEDAEKMHRHSLYQLPLRDEQFLDSYRQGKDVTQGMTADQYETEGAVDPALRQQLNISMNDEYSLYRI